MKFSESGVLMRCRNEGVTVYIPFVVHNMQLPPTRPLQVRSNYTVFARITIFWVFRRKSNFKNKTIHNLYIYMCLETILL